MLAQLLPGIMFLGVQLVTKSPPNNACTRQVGLCAFFSLLRGFKFFPLPNRVHARPLAGNAGRSAAKCRTKANNEEIILRKVYEDNSSSHACACIDGLWVSASH